MHANLEADDFHRRRSKLGDWLWLWLWYWYGYGSIPINTIFSGMNIHLPAILGFTRYQGFDPSPYWYSWIHSTMNIMMILITITMIIMVLIVHFLFDCDTKKYIIMFVIMIIPHYGSVWKWCITSKCVFFCQGLQRFCPTLRQCFGLLNGHFKWSGWWFLHVFNHLENMSSSMGRIIPKKIWNIKFMFETFWNHQPGMANQWI